MSDKSFTAESLRESIVSVYGNSPPHVQMFDQIIDQLKEAKENLEIAVEALENCRKLDTSKIPEYGKNVRGHNPGIGERFRTPKEFADDALRKIRGEK